MRTSLYFLSPLSLSLVYLTIFSLLFSLIFFTSSLLSLSTFNHYFLSLLYLNTFSLLSLTIWSHYFLSLFYITAFFHYFLFIPSLITSLFIFSHNFPSQFCKGRGPKWLIIQVNGRSCYFQTSACQIRFCFLNQSLYPLPK